MFLPTVELMRCCLTSGCLSIRLEILCLKEEHRLLVPKATILIANKISKLLSSSEQLLLGHLLKSVPIMYKLSEKLVIYSMLEPERTARRVGRRG